MPLPADLDWDKIPLPGVEMGVAEVLLDIKEDLGSMKAGVAYLVAADEGTQRRLSKIEKTLAADSAEQSHIKDSLVKVEGVQSKQGDKLTKLLSYSAILIALLGNFLPSSVREAISGVLGQ